jgi:hypothetical protein
MNELVKFTSIGKYSSAVSAIKYACQYTGRDDENHPIFDKSIKLPIVNYKGRVKLHGINCAIVKTRPDSVPYQQSRSTVITPEIDCDGFSSWAEKDFGQSNQQLIFNKINDICVNNGIEIKYPISVYGEWCGKGVKSKVAISKLEKMFVIFAIRMGDEVDHGDRPIGWLDFDLFNDLSIEDNRVFNINKFDQISLDIDFNNPKFYIDILDDHTANFVASCPAGKSMGVSGQGEGLVWMPTGIDSPRLWFKTKSGRLAETKKRKDTEIDYVKLNTIQAIADEFVVEARLDRGISFLNESNKEISKANTGVFVRWILYDIIKDADEDIKSSNIDVREIAKVVSKPISKWFIDYIDALRGD